MSRKIVHERDIWTRPATLMICKHCPNGMIYYLNTDYWSGCQDCALELWLEKLPRMK